MGSSSWRRPVAIFALLVMPAVAGNGKGGGKGNGGSATATSSIALEGYSEYRLGGEVGFTTQAVGLAGWEYPMVAAWCYQQRWRWH